MKNYFKYLLLSILIFIGTNNVFAKQMTSYEIPNNSYVIGTHVYTANVALSTVDIMIASKTINGNSREDMIIYYKTPRGIWINGSTGTKLTAPAVFNIDFINEKIVDVINYGDVNNDGTLNAKDLVLLSRYVATGEIETGFVLANADVNGDGKVNKMDERLLSKYIAGDYPEKDLTKEPLGQAYYIDYVVDTTTLEIYEIDYELKDHVLSSTQKPKDPEKTGYVFKGWYLDIDFKEKFEYDKTKITTNTVLFAKFTKANYGDVNNDGTLNAKDLVLLSRYVATGEIENGFVLANADVNGDGKVNKMDERLLSKYIAGDYPEKDLTKEPLGQAYYIDYVVDTATLEIYETDYELKDHVLSSAQKPKDPEKTGYIFEGWYLDIDFKEKFEYDKTKITTNTVLFAKFTKLD